ncbi:sce7726 family protein [Stenotrophomonas maltophilia]|uniref:sce7726 family protein n=1 Tax=Stenotrophomonas maltophilia TaxID=40324 RepID=UPI000A9EFFEF|nr:sce7726 family protein [Stenotrophomonas maltophilia]MDH2065475.1 sce7726 family protein [Stenotrophomonas maltophilia]QEU33020.1 sce7726 family protein [Stenotrophomonas maltophilia]HDX0901578.1 sce7726 family protein [Stenotrophomonas maltophilia]HDX0919514.1 sce7726 family protein [Stenotrophomonas maltophilia]HEL3012523.1 sce7726 family protein [Stenotrophomonas maltophilia]
MRTGHLDLQSTRDLHRLFEASSLRQIAGGAPTQLLIDVARDFGMHRGAKNFHEVLELAHQLLGRGRRTEYFYKNLLIKKILFGVHSPRTTSVFSEFRIADSRADLVFVNNKAVVYEIKTGLDDLSKAEKQAFDYLSCFTYVSFVLAPNHLDQAQRNLPREVGISGISDRGGISVVRPPERTTKFLSKEAIFNCLLMGEYQQLLRQLGCEGDVEYGQAMSVLDSVDVVEMHEYLVRCLRARDQREIQSVGWSEIPSALLAAACSYQLSVTQWRRVLAVLDTSIDDVL